jgi:MFS family permease
VGIVQLRPVIVFDLLGGTYADRINRRKLLLTSEFVMALVGFLFLALAGISGLFRGVIWNQVVPNNLRGRLSGIEMISYMTGLLLGNTRAGWVAAESSLAISLWSGGIICVIAVLVTAWMLPSFWRYRSDQPS